MLYCSLLVDHWCWCVNIMTLPLTMMIMVKAILEHRYCARSKPKPICIISPSQFKASILNPVRDTWQTLTAFEVIDRPGLLRSDFVDIYLRWSPGSGFHLHLGMVVHYPCVMVQIPWIPSGGIAVMMCHRGEWWLLAIYMRRWHHWWCLLSVWIICVLSLQTRCYLCWRTSLESK